MVALGACGLGDKQQDADAIIDGTKAAFTRGSATGTIAVSAEIESVPDAMGAVGGIEIGGADNVRGAFNQQAARPLVADVVLDFDAETAAVRMPGQARPFAVFDGLDVFGRRYNAGERDARPWVRVDLRDLAEGGGGLSITEDSPFIGAFILNPVFLFDIAAGPLAGSIEKGPVETVAGTETTRFEANFDIDKVLRRTRRSRYGEDRRDAIDETLDTLDVKGRIHAGEVWLDGDGVPRRFTIRLREEPIKRFKLDVVITLEITSFGDRHDIEVPAPAERVEIDNIVQLLRSTIPPVTSAEFASFLGGSPQGPEAAPGTTSTSAAPATTTAVAP